MFYFYILIVFPIRQANLLQSRRHLSLSLSVFIFFYNAVSILFLFSIATHEG